MQCFFEAMRVRWSPTADVARPLCVCAFARLRGSLREVRIWCYHPVRWSAVLQRYFGDGSRTAVDFWCGAVFFSRFSVDARSQREFGGGFLRVYVGGRRAPYYCRFVWLRFFFFHDYLLVFTPLSMKWAPSCAGSFKKKSRQKTTVVVDEGQDPVYNFKGPGRERN